MKTLFDILADIADNYPDSPIWIVGDTNVNCMGKKLYQFKCLLSCTIILLLNFIENYGPTQMVDLPLEDSIFCYKSSVIGYLLPASQYHWE